MSSIFETAYRYSTPLNRESGYSQSRTKPNFSDSTYHSLPNFSSHVSGRSKSKVDKFDGMSDWSDYLKHFELVAAWNGWSREELAVQLSVSLTGTARQIWADSGLAYDFDYDHMVLVLSQRFNPLGQEEAFKAEFRGRSRSKNESFLEHGHALRRLAIKAFPRKTMEDREETVKDQFLQGRLIDFLSSSSAA